MENKKLNVQRHWIVMREKMHVDVAWF